MSLKGPGPGSRIRRQQPLSFGAYAALTIPFDTDLTAETFVLLAAGAWVGTGGNPTRQLAALILVAIALLRILIP